MRNERLDILLDGHLDGSLSPADKTELEQMLREWEAARRQFWARASLHGLSYAAAKLNYAAETAAATANDVPPAKRVAPRGTVNWLAWLPRWGLALGLSAACVVAVGGWFLLNRAPVPNPTSSYNSDDGDEMAEDPSDIAPAPMDTHAVATLTRGAGVIWAYGTNSDLEVGAPLDPGLLRLKSGVVEIQTLSGARMILEGPAELDLVSQQEARLQYGKLSAHVPERAHGFKVQVPGLTVTDLGTEFGVNRLPERPPEVYVFQGKVELALASTRQPAQLLTQGQGVEVQKEQVLPLQTNRVQFTSANELAERERAELQIRYAAWKQVNNEIDEDPGVLAHFNFDSDANAEGQLVNRARQASDVTGGTVTGCRQAEGRWPGKEALEFTNSEDRVQLEVPGRFSSLTYMAWIRIDSLPNRDNALALTDLRQPGEVHWQITRGGGLQLSVRLPAGDNAGDWVRAFSKHGLTPERFGLWTHVAAVCDGNRRTISFYINGRLSGTKRFKKLPPLQLGMINLGNWSSREAQAGDHREFHGRMDEFTLLGRALSSKEIYRQYELGKPRETTTVASLAQPSSSAKQP